MTTIPTTTTHRIERISLGRSRSRVIDRDTRQEWLSSSREPFFAAARLLHSLGAADTDRLEMYRPERETPDMVGTIGSARLLAVTESEKSGPRITRFRAPSADSLATLRGTRGHETETAVSA